MSERAYRRVVDALEAHGCTGRDYGAKAKYTCPVPGHEDRSPSLDVDDAPDRALVICRAGCDTIAVLEELGLGTRDLFDEPATSNGAIEVEFDYVDEDGVLLFQVVRKPGKKFLQRRPDGAGGWVWKLGDTRRVLYRLPAVLAAVKAGETIYVVEGEKDAHAIERAGAVATTNPAGAGKWRPEYADALAGARVIVVADRDKPGRTHAEEIAQALGGVAASVGIVEAAKGKDAADHLAAGLGLGDFVSVAAVEISSPGPPVETAELLDEVGRLVRRFVILPSPAGYRAVALFVLHTWAFDAAHATPYVVVESPEKGSGKTRLLEVLALVCRSAVRVASISAAGLFQTVAGRPTLLVDEADAIFAGNSERSEDLRGVLNAGNAPGAKVIRGGRDGTPVSYETYCPKVIAGIATGRLPDTIRDRAILVPIDKKLKDERVERLRPRGLKDELDALRGQLETWAVAHHDQLYEYNLPGPLEQISDRLEEAWEPLLGIADLAGGAWPLEARRAAEGLAAGDAEDDGGAGHQLLIALQEIFVGEVMATRTILTALNEDENLPFGAWNDGKGLRARDLAKRLKPYRIRPRSVRAPGGTNGYRHEQFTDAWARYGKVSPGGGAELSGTSGTTAAQSQKQALFYPAQTPDVPDNEQAAIPHGIRDVPDVPDKTRPTWTESDIDRLESEYGDFTDPAADSLPAASCRCERPLPDLDEDGERRCARCGRAAERRPT